MTKREMIEAMLAGKTLENDMSKIAFFKENHNPPFVIQCPPEEPKALLAAWGCDGWRICEEPAVRPMTRDEVLGFIAHAPGIVVSYCDPCGEEEWRPAQSIAYCDITGNYKWATITPDGKIGEPHAFDSDAWATYKREVGE